MPTVSKIKLNVTVHLEESVRHSVVSDSLMNDEILFLPIVFCDLKIDGIHYWQGVRKQVVLDNEEGIKLIQHF